MKVITLNLWEGEILEPLKFFINNHSEDIDVFCLQRTLNTDKSNLFELIQDILPNFNGYFSEIVSGIGLATFVNKRLNIDKIEKFDILYPEEIKNLRNEKGEPYYHRIVQVLSIGEPKINIFNFHGIPGNLKQDTLEREVQTKRLNDVLEKYSNPKIIVGDFNLNPDTKGISDLENKMVNLMKGSPYKTTRTRFYTRKDIMPFADYIFTSRDIKVKEFKVLPDEVSDHCALFLEI